MLAVTRELKLALIVGFSLVLMVWVLITDHVQKSSQLDALAPIQSADPSRLSTVGNTAENPFIPKNQLVEPEPRPAKTEQNTALLPSDQDKPVQIPQGGQGGEKAKTSAIDFEEGGLKPTATPDKPYSVQSGDTLYSICKKQYQDASLHSKLAEYNKLPDGKALKLDQKLVLPAKDVLQGKALPYVKSAANPLGNPLNTNKPAVKPASDGPLLEAAVTSASYKVSGGDTLSSIARKYKITLAKLYELNPKLRGREDQLTVGEELRVPSELSTKR